MAQIDEIYAMIQALNPAEREALFLRLRADMSSFHTPKFTESPWVVPGKYPLIVANPNICGGSARIVRTRIPVWVLERMRQLGISESDILRNYPSLSSIDLEQAWSYALEHPMKIEQEIQENEECENGLPLLK